jgi:uncharacterized protein (DUF1810 family)
MDMSGKFDGLASRRMEAGPAMSDRYNLKRFVDAQASVYAQVTAELRAGRKRSHWIWFIFPQIEGLGYSETARHYAIASREEAAAYLADPVLGSRLRECVQLVLAIEGRSIGEILGYPDDLKFRSCLTLFAHAAEDRQLFRDALEKYFGGEEDALTVARLAAGSGGPVY